MSSRITVFLHPLTAEREVLIVEPGATPLRKAITGASEVEAGILLLYQNGKRFSDLDAPLPDDSFFVARMEPQGATGQIVGGIASIMLGTVLIATGIGAGRDRWVSNRWRRAYRHRANNRRGRTKCSYCKESAFPPRSFWRQLSQSKREGSFHPWNAPHHPLLRSRALHHDRRNRW